MDGGDVPGIALGHDEPLFPMHQGDDADVLVGQVLADIAGVVGTIPGVEQVGARQMAPVLFQGHDPTQAADMGRGQGVGGLVPAKEIIEQVQAEIVAAGTEDGAFHLGQGHQQIEFHPLPGLFTLRGCVYAEDGVGAGQGGDGAGPLFQGNGDKIDPDPADDHPSELLDPGPRGEIPGQNGLDRHRRFQRDALQPRQQRHHQLFHGNDGRNRIAGKTDHRLVVDHAENGRLAGHDGDTVHQDLAQLLEDADRVIGAARRGSGIDDDQIRIRFDHGLEVGLDRFEIIADNR